MWEKINKFISIQTILSAFVFVLLFVSVYMMFFVLTPISAEHLLFEPLNMTIFTLWQFTLGCTYWGYV